MRNQFLPNPVAPGTIPYRLSAAGLHLGAQAECKEYVDYLSLRRHGNCAATSATPGILHGEMKRRGAFVVFQERVTAGPEQEANRGCAPGSHGPVQRRCSVLILQIDVRTGIN